MEEFDEMERDMERDMEQLDNVPINHIPYVSVGSVTKQIMAINPSLSAHDIMAIVRESISTQGERAGEFAASETINVEKALELARASLKSH
ncbi:MAG: hypothetical protein H7301_04350 [Cryobacterium sp.]|nr:hypothetical protein [Oligoflexia bacterium]